MAWAGTGVVSGVVGDHDDVNDVTAALSDVAQDT
jgi:hypothetical protein